MVLLCLKIWDLFVLKTYLPTKANYVSTWWDIQEKLIKNITTTTFYFKSKESNENDMPAQVFRAVFYSSRHTPFENCEWCEQPSQIRPKQLKTRVLPFHPLYFPWYAPNFILLYGELDCSCLWYVCMYLPIVALHSMEQSTIIAFSCKCHTVSLSYLCHVVTNRLRIFSMLTHDH